MQVNLVVSNTAFLASMSTNSKICLLRSRSIFRFPKPGYSAAVIWSACHADARHVKLPQALIDEPFAAKIEVWRSILPSA